MIEHNILVGAVIFGLAILVFVVARRLLFSYETRPQRRLAYTVADDGTETLGPVPGPTPDLAVRLDKSFERVVNGAGLGLSASQMLGIFALTGLTLAALFFFWGEQEWAGAAGLALGLALPLVILLVLAARRRRLLQGQLPDAFFFLARSLRAGLTLDQALSRAGDQLDEPLAAEFRRCSGQIHLGLHPYKALQSTAERVRLSDFNIFVSTVGLYYQSGGNLALLLDRLAASTRDRIQFLGYFRAATALGRVAGLVLGAAVPALIIAYAILQPEHTRDLFTTTAGMQLLATAIILEILGIVWFLYLLRVDY